MRRELITTRPGRHNECRASSSTRRSTVRAADSPIGARREPEPRPSPVPADKPAGAMPRRHGVDRGGRSDAPAPLLPAGPRCRKGVRQGGTGGPGGGPSGPRGARDVDALGDASVARMGRRGPPASPHPGRFASGRRSPAFRWDIVAGQRAGRSGRVPRPVPAAAVASAGLVRRPHAGCARRQGQGQGGRGRRKRCVGGGWPGGREGFCGQGGRLQGDLCRVGAGVKGDEGRRVV